MSLPEIFRVARIPPSWTKKFILKMHYAKRMPSITIAFGILKIKNDELVGICTFGIPPNYELNEIVEGYQSIELNRLCIDSNLLEKNILSFFVSSCLKMIDGPIVLISYADIDMNHVGYIYQATNWIYTGMSSHDTEWIKDGRIFHRKSIYNTYKVSSGNAIRALGFEEIKKGRKHRYLYFIGSKKEVKDMKSKLKWPILPYPKGDNKRYEIEEQKPKKGFFFKT